ncbi:MAG: tyrosine protein kinase [Sphingobacteriales bacterium]|nr:tyrosine protein kinase [Sphingobacteriales bacterium]
MAYQKSFSKPSSGMDGNKILEIVSGYAKYWYWFLASVIVCFVIAFLYLKTQTATYKISSTLLIQEDKKGEGVLQGTAFSDLNMFQRTVTVDNEMAALRSRELLEKVFRKLSLQTNYYQDGLFKRSELYGSELPIKVQVEKVSAEALGSELVFTILDNNKFQIKSGDQSKTFEFGKRIVGLDYSIKVEKGPAFKTTADPVIITFRNLSKMAESYSTARLDVAPISKEANTVTLSLIDNVPQRGIDILNKLIETYNVENIENKNKLALNTIDFIDNRLKYLGTDLNSVGQDVEQYKQEYGVADPEASAKASMDQVGAYEKELSGIEIQRNVVESLESYVDNNNGQFELVPSTLGLQDPTLSGLTEKYNELQIERQRLLRTAEPNNPLVVNINEQLSGLKSNIRENLRNIHKSLNIARNNLRSNTSQYQSRIRTAPSIERGLSQRKRQEGVKEGLYEYLLQKREETALSLSATIPTSRVVDPPAAESTPVTPKTSLIYLVAFVMGCLIPASGIFAKDMLNTKVTELNDVEQTGAMILGELSHKENLDTLVVRRSSRTTISELFRYIRTNLNYMTDDNDNKVMLVTSSMKGEGKTFFSLNLGATLSLIDKKVVLLEFDLRKPDLLNGMNMKPGKGITHFINGEVTIDEIIRPSTFQENLFVVGCGTMPEDPAELLMSEKVSELFNGLKERFDYVIIDTSPVGQVADAFSLAPFADSSIYLVRYNYTDKIQLNILKDIFDNGKLNNPMVVLNDSKGDSFKGYGHGGYGYGLVPAKANAYS